MSFKKIIDINCDVAEGVNNEALLMPYISSCNIACNAHAGSIDIIKNVIALAKEHKVKIGAHPSFPDRENFGRKIIDIPSNTLQKSIEDQITLVQKLAEEQSVKIHHVKPHGALYNLIVSQKDTAEIVIKAIKNTLPNTFLYVPFNSVIEKLALKHHITIKYEAFADRNYNNDLSLVSRKLPNALITDTSKLLTHIKNIVINNKVKTTTGFKDILADTICVHGDTENAVEIVKQIHENLQKLEVKIA